MKKGGVFRQKEKEKKKKKKAGTDWGKPALKRGYLCNGKPLGLGCDLAVLSSWGG